jgi:hypothetical protein
MMTEYTRTLIEVLGQIEEDHEAINTVDMALEKFVDCGVEYHNFEDDHVVVYVHSTDVDHATATVAKYRQTNVIKVKSIAEY